MVISAEQFRTMSADEIKALLRQLKLRASLMLGPVRVVRTNRWEYYASDPNDPGHSRWGRINEIVEDLVHYQTCGEMPRSTPARPW